MTRDEQLEHLLAKINRLGLGQYSVIPPSAGVDRWDVTFDQTPSLTARGIAYDGKSSFENLLTDVARVAAVYRRGIRSATAQLANQVPPSPDR